MNTEKQMDKIKLRLTEQLNEARQMEIRIDTMKQVMVCEDKGHDWKVHSTEGELTSLRTVKLWCGECPCYVDIGNLAPFKSLQELSIMISVNGDFSQTLTSFLGDEEE
tara:strand:+ start:180 stop:503 length:324 start_codon:yes stop_codon:yes gene_type:complete